MSAVAVGVHRRPAAHHRRLHPCLSARPREPGGQRSPRAAREPKVVARQQLRPRSAFWAAHTDEPLAPEAPICRRSSELAAGFRYGRHGCRLPARADYGTATCRPGSARATTHCDRQVSRVMLTMRASRAHVRHRIAVLRQHPDRSLADVQNARRAGRERTPNRRSVIAGSRDYIPKQSSSASRGG